EDPHSTIQDFKLDILEQSHNDVALQHLERCKSFIQQRKYEKAHIELLRCKSSLIILKETPAVLLRQLPQQTAAQANEETTTCHT
ncbi:hypothetical protein VIGAN_11074700, partial [Vigna angularis var. angularis]